MDVSEIIPSHLHIHRIIQMNKSFIIILLSFVVQYSVHGFTPVIDTPYSDMYHDTENMELLTLYTEITALEQRYNAAVAREQSLANRMLGAAAIGAGGIGGMMLASGIAEQRADADAERDMAAYLATFKCNYGAGMTVAGGQTNVQLPGANVLLPLYNEYITLATDLQARKEVLGMAPGIESEIISDAATSGLYDNTAIGITDGAYTSVSRALSDTTDADAVAWSAQQSETAQKVQTGGIVGGAGVVGGAVGNVLINHVFDNANNVDTNINNKQGI